MHFVPVTVDNITSTAVNYEYSEEGEIPCDEILIIYFIVILYLKVKSLTNCQNKITISRSVTFSSYTIIIIVPNIRFKFEL